MTSMTRCTVNPSMSLRDLVAQCPPALAVLTEYGMDACCGGDLTVERAAKAHGVELGKLVRKLEAAAGRES